MNKNELYDLHKVLNISSNTFMNSLKKIIMLKGIDSHLFYKTCINIVQVINDDNFDSIINIFLKLCCLDDISSKRKICDMFTQFLDKDYIVTSEDFDDILDMISKILEFPASSIGLDSDLYILKFIENYFNLFTRDEFKYETLYKYDFSFLSFEYESLLQDLINTDENNTDDFSSCIIKRLELFISILTDDKVIDFDEEKYKSIVLVATSITNINELKRFYNKIKILSNDIPSSEFRKIIDTYSSELNYNTIRIIFDELEKQIKEGFNGERKLIESDFGLEEQDDLLRRILVDDSNPNIIKFQ